MSDQELRELERLARASDDPADAERYLRARVRAGDVDAADLPELLAVAPQLAGAVLELLPSLPAADPYELFPTSEAGTQPLCVRLGGYVLLTPSVATIGYRAVRLADGRLVTLVLLDRTVTEMLGETVVAELKAVIEAELPETIAPLLEWGTASGVGYAAAGIDLTDAELLSRVHVPADPAQALAWVESLARGVGAVHARGLVHGGVAAQHVERVNDGWRLFPPVLAAFQEATGTCYNFPRTLPDEGVYLPPGIGTAGRSALDDVGQLGLILHGLLTGQLWTEEQLREGNVFGRVMYLGLPPLREVLPEATPAAEALLQLACSPLRDGCEPRYPDANALADAIAEAAAEPLWTAPREVPPLPPLPPEYAEPEPEPEPEPAPGLIDRLLKFFR